MMDEAIQLIFFDKGVSDDLIARVRARGISQRRVDPVHGDCFRASIATALGLPMDAVPDVRYMGHDVPRLGVEASTIQEREARHAWWGHWFDYLGSFNLTLVRSDRAVHGPDLGVVHLGTVESPRGSLHTVVCVDGQIVWDPSPTQDCYGLPLAYCDFFVALDPAHVRSPEAI